LLIKSGHTLKKNSHYQQSWCRLEESLRYILCSREGRFCGGNHLKTQNRHPTVTEILVTDVEMNKGIWKAQTVVQACGEAVDNYGDPAPPGQNQNPCIP
jgi:hypothetical protein